MNKRSKIFLIVSIILLVIIWMLGMIEVTTLASYRNCFTAGELFAWVTANNYEVNDIIQYCLRNNMWYYVLYSAICIVLYFVFRFFAQRRMLITGIILWCFLLFPFVYPNSPLNLMREVYYVSQQVKSIEQNKNNNTTFSYSAQKSFADSTEIYVLSIGESLRYKNLSINGVYPRETTPSLAQQSNLFLYSDYYAAATLTQHALPMLLTGVQSHTFNTHYERKTIAAAFAEAGFYTMLISHRAQLMNNGYHNYLAQDIDSIIWVEHDSLIHSTLSQVMNMHPKLFVITHYLGNHMFYTNRTEDCLVWRPDYNADPNVQSDSLFFNAYDNSILYTDYLLNQEIETLRQFKGIAAWFFISDHGEYIDHRVSGHGHTYHPTKDEYHVPLMVWYSDEYAATYPSKVANMIKHKDEPVCGDHVFWSVLDMAGIEIDSTLQKDGMSIFGDSLRPHQRTLLLPDGKTIMEL